MKRWRIIDHHTKWTHLNHTNIGLDQDFLDNNNHNFQTLHNHCSSHPTIKNSVTWVIPISGQSKFKILSATEPNTFSQREVSSEYWTSRRERSDPNIQPNGSQYSDPNVEEQKSEYIQPNQSEYFQPERDPRSEYSDKNCQLIRSGFCRAVRNSLISNKARRLAGILAFHYTRLKNPGWIPLE